MITRDLERLIWQSFGHRPTPCQERAVGAWAGFLLSDDDRRVFLLSGYAGTGKTSLVAALVRVARRLGQPVELLAPTGRAAKVFSLYAGAPAHTIHKRIYRQKSLTDPDRFLPGVNTRDDTLFIVDEASMIANRGLSGSMFGSGRVLDDLVRFVYSRPGCRLMLVGDAAQLPPVGEEESPALSAGEMGGYGLRVLRAELDEVVRQAEGSGVLWNATRLRALVTGGEQGVAPRLRVSGFADVRSVPGTELIEELECSYRECGVEETVVVTRSNRRAVLFNNGIRARVMDRTEELSRGDLVMVAKNNYYWAETALARACAAERERLPFIANGDVAEVRSFGSERELYGFRFADVTLRFPDYGGAELRAAALLDTLGSEAPALTREQQQRLFEAVWEDYADTRSKRDRMRKLRADPHFNALQVKYAYAVTCHKAQGGQWRHVYVDQGYVTRDMLTPDYYRWLYTALTRATERVYLVNWPDGQTE